MKRVHLLKDQKGTSMIFALVLFLVVTVFGVNLLNAVNANVLDTNKELEKEQTLLYITSAYEVVNEMICEGKFLDAGKMPSGAKAEFSGKNNPVKIELKFLPKSSGIQATIIITCNSEAYEINNYYVKTGDKYRLERCYGLEGA